MWRDTTACPAGWTSPSRTGPTALPWRPAWWQEAPPPALPLWSRASSFGCKAPGTFRRTQPLLVRATCSHHAVRNGRKWAATNLRWRANQTVRATRSRSRSPQAAPHFQEPGNQKASVHVQLITTFIIDSSANYPIIN